MRTHNRKCEMVINKRNKMNIHFQQKEKYNKVLRPVKTDHCFNYKVTQLNHRPCTDTLITGNVGKQC